MKIRGGLLPLHLWQYKEGRLSALWVWFDLFQPLLPIFSTIPPTLSLLAVHQNDLMSVYFASWSRVQLVFTGIVKRVLVFQSERFDHVRL